MFLIFEVRSLALSPDGAFFASGASDSSIRLWALKPTGLRTEFLLGNNSWSGSERPQRWQSDKVNNLLNFNIVYSCVFKWLFLYLIHWFLIFFPVWVPILYVKHESRSRLTKTEDGAPAWKLRDQIWWTAVQWFYAINGSCEKDQKERCSRVPMVMLCLVTNFKLRQVKCIVKFRCRVGDCNCVITSKESHHSLQVSDLLSELKARREQVGQRNLGSEA